MVKKVPCNGEPFFMRGNLLPQCESINKHIPVWQGFSEKKYVAYTLDKVQTIYYICSNHNKGVQNGYQRRGNCEWQVGKSSQEEVTPKGVFSCYPLDNLINVC